ncbi:hypothetical protein [Fodinicola feengrottensis]|uniref:Uncharacterized protein n=1 Tax=Fodinicola feengrottensis TaxID=435914 RepID=A0ABN2HPZ3_9ACTN|nr:hypothetical protein [Fodinicola feengrottensis]
MPYDHRLTGPLGMRGMRAMFAVAAPRPLSDRMWAERYDQWCSRLHSRASVAHIAWMPASGEAYTFADVPTVKVEAILLRILENTPVAAAIRRVPPTARPA